MYFTIFNVLLLCLLLLFVSLLICSYDDDDDTGSSYASPYRSLLSAASLAASVKVNSVVRPALNPALSAQLNISMLQVKFTNHLHAIGQGKPIGIHLCMLGCSDRNTQKDNFQRVAFSISSENFTLPFCVLMSFVG